MKKQLQLFIICLSVFSITHIKAQEKSKRSLDVVNVGSEVRSFTSAINNKDYKLLINLPESYQDNASKEYPVLYILDGQWDFTNVVSSYGNIFWDRAIPELIIVGITYAGDRPDYETLRANDFTPSVTNQNSNSGGARTFVEVIEKEIIPLMDSTYRTNKKDRAIAGTSFAGLFSHYVLFNAPHLFNGYIINNPSLWWDNQLPFRYEETYAKENDTLDARVYMVSGGFDDLPRFVPMTEQIQSRKYKKLRFESHIVEEMGHSGSKSEGYARGLLHLYKREGISLSDAVLQEYVGTYQINSGPKIELKISNGHLTFKPDFERPEIHIYAINNKEFSMNGHYGQFNFTRDDNNNVTGFVAEIVREFMVTFNKVQDSKIIEDGAELTLVSDDYKFTEGPAVDKQGNVYFTDQPNDRILKWNATDNSISEYMKPSGRSNGLYFDNQGNLLSAADEKNELWRIDSNKKVTVLIDNYDGKKLNGPNDLWVDGKGGIYFTDPYYQRPWWKHNAPQQKENRVYYLAPNADTPQIVANDNYVQPNGIIGSSDGKTLYVADHGDKKTYVFTILENGNLTNRKLFADMGSDGMTIDNLGNIYLTGDGVTVFNSKGEKIQHIVVPEGWTANVTFGGLDKKTLFITAMDSVYTLEMTVHGVR